MTTQIPKIDSSDLAPMPEIVSQNVNGPSFEEKLKSEQARLGLLFSPFSQLGAFFYSDNQFDSQQDENGSSSRAALEQNSGLANSSNSNLSKTANSAHNAPNQTAPPQSFDSLSTRTLSQQWVKELFIRNHWLTPNLQGQSLFYQAFLDGKLLASFDLQSLVDEIASRVALVKDKGRTQISLTLQPEELGEILLTLTSLAGAISVQIQASSDTKKLLLSQRDELALALKKANINVDEIIIEEVKSNA